jgi:hypothetical protein
VCVIIRLDPPTTPTTATLAQKIFDPSKTIDLTTPGFQQVPACGYFLVETFTWTIPTGAPITENNSGGSKYKIDVVTTDPTKHNTYSVTLGLSALYATLQTTFTQNISFTVTVTDPCRTTTITPFTLTNISM